jgi:hypothetical protein
MILEGQMKRQIARFLATLAVTALLPVLGWSAQLSTPGATADNESWYLSGAPINIGGTIYYPAGPVTHFNRNEMIFTGLFERVPVYKRTTQEPGSVIYVPLAGGLVRPYERRRSGELAGTVGSSAPSFPVSLPAAEVSQAAGPGFFGTPTPVIPRPVGTTGFLYGTAEPQPVGGIDTTAPSAVATSGIDPNLGTWNPGTATSSGPARVETVRQPVGLNAIFVHFRDTRWYAAGPAVVYSSDRFTRIGDYRGFTVYEENGQRERIFLSTVDGDPALLVPYEAR